MPWVIRSAFGGVVAYFFFGWLWSLLKFTFWPLLFSMTLGWLYEDVSGITDLNAERKAIERVERDKVVLVSSAFVPRGPYQGHFSEARVTIRNDGNGEAQGIRIRCKVAEKDGRLVRQDGRDILVDAVQTIATEKNDLIVPAHQSVTLALELPLVPTLRRELKDLSDLYDCALEVRSFQVRPTIMTEEG